MEFHFKLLDLIKVKHSIGVEMQKLNVAFILTLIGKSWTIHPEFFSKISVFRGITQTDFWKIHPVFF